MMLEMVEAAHQGDRVTVKFSDQSVVPMSVFQWDAVVDFGMGIALDDLSGWKLVRC